MDEIISDLEWLSKKHRAKHPHISDVVDIVAAAVKADRDVNAGAIDVIRKLLLEFIARLFLRSIK